MTADYVSANIDFLINQASRVAMNREGNISMIILEETIATHKHSVAKTMLDEYEALRNKFEGNN